MYSYIYLIIQVLVSRYKCLVIFRCYNSSLSSVTDCAKFLDNDDDDDDDDDDNVYNIRLQLGINAFR